MPNQDVWIEDGLDMGAGEPHLTAELASDVWQKWKRTSFSVFAKAYLPDMVPYAS